MKIAAALAHLEHRAESRKLLELETADAASVRKWADQALANLLLTCRERVPFYRQALARTTESAIRSAPRDALRDLPVLEKRHLHEHFQALRAEGLRASGVRRNATGGSTGETAQFLQDSHYRRWNRAVLACFERWAGYRPGGRKVMLWGIPRDIERSSGPAHGLKDRLLNRMTLNAYNLSDETMQAHAALLRRKRPDLLRVFTQSGIEFARFLESRGETLPVAAVTCSGALLHPAQRALMERVYQAPVHDAYGSREVGPMAAEYRAGGGLRVCPATHLIEILRPDGMDAEPGEEGEIHVTLLINQVMPLLRYRIGDRGVWADPEPADDQPSWPCIQRLIGRTMEHVIAEDGTRRNSQLMSELVMFVGWIRRFQWVQQARDRIELRIEPHAGHPTPDEAERLERELNDEIQRIIGPNCRFDLSLHERIEPSPSGKFHYVVCSVH